MPCACVDIGSNTTRLLLADCRGGTLRELMTQRVFTRLGRSIRRDGAIPADKLEETAGVVERQVRHARELGADRIAIVATAAIRQARNGGDLTGAQVRMKKGGIAGVDRGELKVLLRPADLEAMAD